MISGAECVCGNKLILKNDRIYLDVYAERQIVFYSENRRFAPYVCRECKRKMSVKI